MIRPESIKPVFDCKKCSLHKFASFPVWGRGPKKPLFILVGEGPGREEDEHRMPFYKDAPVGGMVMDILKEIGVARSEIYLTNATRCFKGFKSQGGGEIPQDSIKECKPYLQDELDKIDCDYIVLAGNEAMKSVLGHIGITKEHGLLRVGPNGKHYFPILHPGSALPFRTPENRNRIKEALANLVKKIRKGDEDPLAKFDCKIITTEKMLDRFEHELKSLPAGTLAFSDYETNSKFSPFHINDFIVSGASFVWEETGGWYLPLDHQNPANIWDVMPYARVVELFKWYARSSLRKGNQNIKYEYNVTRGRFGVRMRRIYTDPMLHSHLLQPQPGTHGLDKLAWKVDMGGYDEELERWFQDNKIPDGERNYTKVPLEVLGRYAIADGICALKYHNKYYPTIRKRDQIELYHTRVMQGPEALANMEAKGMLLDVKYMKKLNRYYIDRHKIMRKQLRQLAREDGLKLGKDFNFDSPEQMAGFIHKWLKLEPLRQRILKREAEQATNKSWKRRNDDKVSTDPADYISFNVQVIVKRKDGTTKKRGGLVSTDKQSLKGLLAFWKLSDIQRKFLLTLREYRAGRTRYTRNVKGMRKFICPDKRIRSSLLQHGTTTSRRASRDPNLQNIPRDAIVKRAFIAPKNYILVNNDCKNLEVRIAAAKSGDKALLAAFNQGKDIHSYLGSRAYNIKYDDMVGLLGTPWDKVKENEKMRKRYLEYLSYRNRAKVIWWVLLFGGGPDKIADGSGITFNEACRLQQVMFEEFPGLQDMFDDFADFADEHGYAETDFGRRRYLDGISSQDKRTYNEARRQSLNTPIQGTAADITLLALILLDKKWRELKLRAWNVQEVHDSIAVETHWKDMYAVMVKSKKIMESITCPSSKGKIVFEIDTNIGCHLGSKLRVDDKILEMARTDPYKLYKMCRKDLFHDPEWYVEAG